MNLHCSLWKECLILFKWITIETLISYNRKFTKKFTANEVKLSSSQKSLFSLRVLIKRMFISFRFISSESIATFCPFHDSHDRNRIFLTNSHDFFPTRNGATLNNYLLFTNFSSQTIFSNLSRYNFVLSLLWDNQTHQNILIISSILQ